MNTHTDPLNTQQLTVTLELLSEGSYEADFALVAAVGRATVEVLEQERYMVRPVAPGQRGGDFVVQVLALLEAVPADVWAQRALVERVMTDAGTLVTICVGVVPLLRQLLRVHKQQEAKQHMNQQPLKMTLEIDGHPVSVEAQDVEEAEAAFKLAKRIYEQQPDVAKRVTPRSSVKVKGTLPAQPQRKRR